jgi:CO/xanthine dehydrogenase Mo-binding subunit
MVTVSFADTDVTPYDTSTTASRSTFHMGNAVRLAALDAKRQLLKLAGPILKIEPEGLRLQNGSILTPDGESLPIEQVLKTTFGAGAGAAVLGQAVFKPEDILGLEDMRDKQLEAFSTLSAFHGYAVQGAEVMVNLNTGAVKVLRMVAAHDVGKAINPDNCKQQIEGALGMGLGFALTEEFHWEKGGLLNPNFLHYPVLTSPDIPPVTVFLVEKSHPQGPFGAKGMGEIAATPTAPAIANAVYDACGVRIYDLPIKPDKIFWKLPSQKKS